MRLLEEIEIWLIFKQTLRVLYYRYGDGIPMKIKAMQWTKSVQWWKLICTLQAHSNGAFEKLKIRNFRSKYQNTRENFFENFFRVICSSKKKYKFHLTNRSVSMSIYLYSTKMHKIHRATWTHKRNKPVFRAEKI